MIGKKLSKRTTLQVIMPMAGLGQRFRAVGVTTPKPLILVDGQPMFTKALDSFRDSGFELRLISIVREEDDRRFGIREAITKAVAGAETITITASTRGAVETALHAEPFLDPGQPVVVLDCDIAFESSEYFRTIERAVRGEWDGVLLAFPSTEPRYSYARVDGTGHVIETAEKKTISTHALMGAYFFTRARDFITASHELLSRQISEEVPEYYVSLLFNILIKGAKRVGLSSGTFYCFGTPEELAAYQRTGEPVSRVDPPDGTNKC